MSRLRHIYEPGMTYLITTITHRRERLFEDEKFARIAYEDIAFYAHKFGVISAAHAIMPDHMHWVMHPSPEDFERFRQEEQAKGKRSKYGHAPERFYLSKIMEDYKRHTAHLKRIPLSFTTLSCPNACAACRASRSHGDIVRRQDNWIPAMPYPGPTGAWRHARLARRRHNVPGTT